MLLVSLMVFECMFQSILLLNDRESCRKFLESYTWIRSFTLRLYLICLRLKKFHRKDELLLSNRNIIQNKKILTRGPKGYWLLKEFKTLVRNTPEILSKQHMTQLISFDEKKSEALSNRIL